jgi:hypothetical protein
MWVIKDSMANGAGGIWFLSPTNAADFLPPPGDDPEGDSGADEKKRADLGASPGASPGASRPPSHPLIGDHEYVVQRYSAPAMLYRERKAHVRIYGLVVHELRPGAPPSRAAYLNALGFLHVANVPFKGYESSDHADQQLHVSNCCANSGDKDQFLGEIVVDFLEADRTEGDILQGAWGQLNQTFAAYAASVLPFTDVSLPPKASPDSSVPPVTLFDYCGVDVIVTRCPATGRTNVDFLEINAPPSQDTATGLPRAEAVHDNSVGGILTGAYSPCPPPFAARQKTLADLRAVSPLH